MEREQYICCFDIENSVIYTIWYHLRDNIYCRCPKFTKKIERELTNTNRGYFIESEKQDVELAIFCVNKLYNTKYELVAMTEKYLSNFYIKTPDNKYLSFFARTPEEDNEIFTNQLIKKWIKGADILFTAHNIDYEYSYIRYNTNFLQTLKEISKDYFIIAENVSTIKCIEFTNSNGAKFIIKDTYLMTNKKIAKLGDEFNLPKLDYNYTVFRTASEELTKLDYKYNKRDNEIALMAIEQLQTQIEKYSDVTRLPISATHHSKNVCMYNRNVNRKVGKYKLNQTHKSYAKLYNMPTLELYQFFFNASGGGLIFVNPKYLHKFISNVLSFDIRSAHPSQMYNKRYPQGNTTKEIESENFDYIIEKYIKYSNMLKQNPTEFYNCFNPIQDYLMLIEFTDLSARVLPHDNIILSLGSGKQLVGNRESVVTNRLAINIEPETVNGKTIKSKKYIKWLYGIDLIYHLTFYSFKDIKIKKCYKYKLVPCSEYIISKADYYGQQKEVYKSFTKFAKKHNFEETYNFVVSHKPEEYTIKGLKPEDYVQFLDNELLRIKGIFNGLFGQEYQNLLHDCEIFTDDFDIVKNTNINPDYNEILSKTSVHYCTGAYIAAWSRVELACMIWHCINNGGTVLYGATDSVKVINVDENLFDNWLVEQLNKWYSHNKLNFGSVDFEIKYNLFYIPETLKNIGILNKNNKIHISFTISGFKAEIYFSEIIKQFEGKPYTTRNINKLTKALDDMLQPHVIPPEMTGKYIRSRKFCGIKTPLGQINFGALEAVPYQLLGG